MLPMGTISFRGTQRAGVFHGSGSDGSNHMMAPVSNTTSYIPSMRSSSLSDFIFHFDGDDAILTCQGRNAQ